MKYRFISAIITTLFISNLLSKAHAFDLDMTVEDDIRKNYNSSQLVDDTGISSSIQETNTEIDVIIPDPNLPELPSISKQQTTKKPSDVKGAEIVPPQKTIPYQGGNIKIKKGTSFDVVNSNAISDWQTKGTKVRFTTKKTIYGKYYSIPANTVFNGEIIESHQPQITCNGGLVVIRVNSMIYKGQTVPIQAYVTRANGNKIFLNNIKGDRTYLKTTWKKGNWGRTLFNKMLNLTVSLGGEGATIAISPFPIAYGTICLGVNAITSPICAFFSKGGHVSIPANSQFRIKLLEDTFIN